MLAEYQTLARRFSSANSTYESDLEERVSTEIHKRDSNAIARRINSAKVPAIKELAVFDFASIPSLNKAKVLELSKCGYIASKSNVVLMGPPGVSKMRIAIRIAISLLLSPCTPLPFREIPKRNDIRTCQGFCQRIPY